MDSIKLYVRNISGLITAEAVGLPALLDDLQNQMGQDVLLGIAEPPTNPYFDETPCDTDPAEYDGFSRSVYFLANKNGVYDCFKKSDGQPIVVTNEICFLYKPFMQAWQKVHLYPLGGAYTHPTGFEDQPEEELSGSTVISQVEVSEEGHVTGVKVRDLGTSLEWNEATVEHNTETVLLDLNQLKTGDITSSYICITALFGAKHYTPGKKVSLVATRISEFAVHETADEQMHGADVKTQHTGIYAKYADSWGNIPDVLAVDKECIKIYVSGDSIVAKHTFDKGEDIEPELTCKYRIDQQKIVFDG